MRNIRLNGDMAVSPIMTMLRVRRIGLQSLKM